MLSSEIGLLMYSTFAVQSGESARQERLALVLSYVLLWSNRAVIHLENDDSWNNPPSARADGSNATEAVAAKRVLFLRSFVQGGSRVQRRVPTRLNSCRRKAQRVC
jgi:hypothetical protein